MMRLFTFATISSMMAARPVVTDVRTAARTRRTARAGRLVLVVTGVVERENGAVDMDVRVLPEVRDVAIESLLPLLAEQLHLHAVTDVRHVRVLRLHRAHLLEDQEQARVLDDPAHLARTELEGGVPDLGG